MTIVKLSRLRLTVQAWWLLLFFDAARLIGFARIHRLIRGTATSTPRRGAPAIADVVWAAEEACVWYVKRAACLQRSAVVTWLLRRNGVSATLVIGYRPIPFDSHAWVEVNGAVVNDRAEYQRYFTVLDRL